MKTSRAGSVNQLTELPKRHLAILAVASLCLSCDQWDLGVDIPFLATWNGEPLACDSAEPALTDLRFYVSDPQLIDSEGRIHDVRFATEMHWQNDAVALIDLENGEAACINGTPDVFNHLVGVARAGEYRGLRFTVGVPFSLNHANPLTAAPPLNDEAMHWHWRSGYKFLRAGIRTGNDGFWIHVGSTGCKGTVGHVTGCRFPNRVQVELPEFIPGKSTVAIDLAALTAGVNLEDGKPGDCSSGPAEISCLAAFGALGINHATGEQKGIQSVFSVR
jgi:uncharacterized repeat protein (TIGR04052 family)